MNNSLKYEQDAEFYQAQLLDGINEFKKDLDEKNKIQKELIDLIEISTDLSENIKNQNKYNNPRLNIKYDNEIVKLSNLQKQLNNINIEINKIQDKIKTNENLLENILD